MPTMCIQCSMRAMIDGKAAPVFNETPEEHLKRVHPDPTVTAQERAELERQFREKVLHGEIG